MSINNFPPDFLVVPLLINFIAMPYMHKIKLANWNYLKYNAHTSGLKSKAYMPPYPNLKKHCIYRKLSMYIVICRVGSLFASICETII